MMPFYTGGLEAFTSPLWIAVFVVIGVWEAVWKGIAMWKSARGSQIIWFICILAFNTAGILPIVYLLFFQKKAKRSK